VNRESGRLSLGGTAVDWTRGRVAFDDAVIEEVWVLTGMGTVVEIGR